MTACKSEDAPLALRYMVRNPKIETTHNTTLILLHGVGSNEQDMFGLASQFPENYRVISARAPLTVGNESYAWYPLQINSGKFIYNFEEAEKSSTILEQFIAELKQKYELNSNDIYLVGFSQGAIMSYNLALTEPTLVKGIAVMSGRLMDEIKPKIAAIENLKKLRIFISHGTSDTTLPVQFAREALSYLKSHELNPEYHEYAEGHGINAAMLQDLLHWLSN